MEKNIELTVKGFEQGGLIAPRFTCDGSDTSPEITWKNIPLNAESLVIIMEDPDASNKTIQKPLFCHWIIYNIPVTLPGLPADFPKTLRLKSGIMQGLSDFKKPGYGGPCPGSGLHRYYFRLYALDCALEIEPEKTDWQVICSAIKGHNVGYAEFMGRYERIK
jgi:Raf kinase inhibitor-like YbhB/YbcL family protein